MLLVYCYELLDDDTIYSKFAEMDPQRRVSIITYSRNIDVEKVQFLKKAQASNKCYRLGADCSANRDRAIQKDKPIH